VIPILFRKFLKTGLILASVSMAWALKSAAQTDVLTWHNDVARTGRECAKLWAGPSPTFPLMI
jgi:hypothetical protein